MRVTIPLVVSMVCAAALAAAQTPPTAQAAPTAAAKAPAAQGAPAAGPIPNPVLLTVNGEPVHAAAVRLAVQNVVGQARRQGEKIDQQKALQAGIQQVVDTKLLAQEARRRNVEFDAAKAGEILANIERQAGGRDALEASLGRAGVTLDDFTSAINEAELAEDLVERDIRPNVTVSDEELKSYYDEHPDMFKHPEEVHARHILIKVPADATPEQDAQAKERAEAARKRAVSGEDFAALAKELSEDPSADKGGDLGFFAADQMVEPFASAAFALEPGAISALVKTRFGYHVIKVEERRPAGTNSLDEVKDDLRYALLTQKVGQEVGNLLQSLREKADIQQMAPPAEAKAPEAKAPAGAPATPAASATPPAGP